MGVGVILSCLFFMKKSSDIVEKAAQVTSAEDLMKDEEWPDERIGIPHPNGRMIDATTSQMLYAKEQEDTKEAPVVIKSAFP